MPKYTAKRDGVIETERGRMRVTPGHGVELTEEEYAANAEVFKAPPKAKSAPATPKAKPKAK